MLSPQLPSEQSGRSGQLKKTISASIFKHPSPGEGEEPEERPKVRWETQSSGFSGYTLQKRDLESPAHMSANNLQSLQRDMALMDPQSQIFNLVKKVGQLELMVQLQSEILERNGLQLRPTKEKIRVPSKEKHILPRESIPNSCKSVFKSSATINSEPFDKVIKKRRALEALRMPNSQRESLYSVSELHKSQSSSDLVKNQGSVAKMKSTIKSRLQGEKRSPVLPSPNMHFESGFLSEGLAAKMSNSVQQEYNPKYFLDKGGKHRRVGNSKLSQIWAKNREPVKSTSSLNSRIVQLESGFSILDRPPIASTSTKKKRPRLNSQSQDMKSEPKSSANQTEIFSATLESFQKRKRVSSASSKKAVKKTPDIQNLKKLYQPQSAPEEQDDFRSMLSRYKLGDDLKQKIVQILDQEAKARTDLMPSEFTVSSHMKSKETSFPDQDSKQGIRQLQDSREFSFAGGNVPSSILRVPAKQKQIFLRPVLPAQILYEGVEPEIPDQPNSIEIKKDQPPIPSLANSNLWYSGTLPSSNFLTPALLSPTAAGVAAGRDGKQTLSTKIPVSGSDHQLPTDFRQGAGSLISSFEQSRTDLQKRIVPNQKHKKDGTVFQVATNTGIEYMVGPQKKQTSGYGDILAAGTFGSGSSPARYTPANSQRLEFNLTPSGKEPSSPILVLNPRALTMVELQRFTIMGQSKPKYTPIPDSELSSTRLKEIASKKPSEHYNQPESGISDFQRKSFLASQVVNSSTPQLGLSRASDRIPSVQARAESEDEDIDLRHAMSILPNSPDKRSSNSAYVKPHTANDLVIPDDGLGNQNFSEAPSSIDFEEPFARKSSAPQKYSHQAGASKNGYLRQQTTPDQPGRIFEANPFQFDGQLKPVLTPDGSTLLGKDTQQIGLFSKKKGFKQIPQLVAEKMSPEPQKASASPGKSAKTYLELRKSQPDVKSYTPTSYKQELKPLQSIIKPRDQPEPQGLKLNPVQSPLTAPAEPIRPRQDTTPTVRNQPVQSRANPASGSAQKPPELSVDKGIIVSPTAASKPELKDKHPRSKPPASPNLKVAAKVNSFRKREEHIAHSNNAAGNTSGEKQVPSRVPVTLTHIQVSRFSPDKQMLTRGMSSPQMLYQFDDQFDDNHDEESAATLKGRGKLVSNPSSPNLQAPTTSKRAQEFRPGFFNPPVPGHSDMMIDDQPPSPGKSRHKSSLSLRTAGGVEQDLRHSNPLTFQGMVSETHNPRLSESRPSFGSEHLLPHSHSNDPLETEQND